MKIIKNKNDLDFLAEVEEAIKNNDGYCCCAIEHLPEYKCPCKEFVESTELGQCNCGRYIKVEV